MIDGWGAAHHGSGRYVVWDAALGYGDRSVTYLDVAAYAYLAGEDYVVAYLRGAREAHLRAEQRVMTDGAAVAYVN